MTMFFAVFGSHVFLSLIRDLFTHKTQMVALDVGSLTVVAIILWFFMKRSIKHELNSTIQIEGHRFVLSTNGKTSLDFHLDQVHRLGYTPGSCLRAIYYGNGDVYRYGPSVENVRQLDDLLKKETGLDFVDLNHFQPAEITYSQVARTR